MNRAARITFAVPLTPGDYAPEVHYFSKTGLAEALDFVNEYEGIVEELPADAVLEVEALRLEGDPTEDADWFLIDSVDDTGIWDNDGLLGWHLRLRAKSGGTAGDAIVSLRSKG